MVNALREWKPVCPKRSIGKKDANGELVKLLDLMFPNKIGKVESHANLMERGLDPHPQSLHWCVRDGASIISGL
jgi:integrase